MRTKNLVLSVFALLLFTSFAYAQVRGVVIEEGLGPVFGALVTVEETGVSTETNEAGVFNIDAQIGQNLIIQNPINFAEKRFAINNLNMGQLALGDASIALSEVITMGYDRTTTRAESIGAQSVISAETFENRPTTSFLNSVQGAAPGVMIQSASGSPGSAQITALIRGRSSINANLDPLIVVDGVPMGNNQFRNLNQADFESVNILRDAHATAIYGNRAANGVIVITTKSGRYNQDLEVNVNSMMGMFTLPTHDYNLANARQSLTLQNRANSGFGATLTQEQIDNWGTDTDWLGHFFNYGINQQHDVQLSQGGENFRSFYSLGYQNVEGMVPTTDFQRFSVRANIAGKTRNDRFDYGTNLQSGFSVRHQLDSETNANIRANVIQNPLQGAMIALPYLQSNLYPTGQGLYNAIGSNFGEGRNVHVLEDVLRPGHLPNVWQEFSILANAYGRYKITDDLSVRNKVSVDYKHQTRNFARAPWSYLAIVVAQNANLDYGGIESLSHRRDVMFTNVTSLEYSKVLAERHSIFAAAYMEYTKAHLRTDAHQQNGLDPATWALGAGTGWVPRSGDNYIPSHSAGLVDAGMFAIFGTLDYEFDGKYAISGTLRRDASYRFIDEQKWGTFWSVAGRWNIDREAFMDGSAFSLLKLRGSYGLTGNQNISVAPYDYNPMYMNPNAALDYNTTSGSGYLNQNAIVSVLGNNTLQWEVIKQANIGLDWIVFNNRFEGNLDLYRKNTTMLFDTQPISGVHGQYAITGNNGEIQNQGIELNLRYHAIRQENARLTFWGNGAYNDNKVIDLFEEDTTPGGTANLIGGPINQWYLLNYLGVNPENGNLLFADVDGNPTEQPDLVRDAVRTGYSALPRYVGGFGVQGEYNGFFADVQFSYMAGMKRWDNQLYWLYDGSPASVAGYNVSADLLNAWTPENPNANMPALANTNQSFDGDSDRYLYDASFVRLRNVQVGYSVPGRLLRNTFVKQFTVFAQGENLAVWSDWRGFDPEGYQSTALGVYPNPRTISFGFNARF
ncbi:MAG: SusC/RagA family TonB-linked outer membrane protein [Weeksellaceae bacterium]|nr:SusC/RagA family TonB-linked outer membrane protein [Weeksellaceae bacterium]